MADQTSGDPRPVSDLYSRLSDFLFGAPLPQDGGTVTRWVQLADWSDAQQAVVVGLVGLVLLVSLWNIRRATTWKARCVLLGLRVAIIAVLLFAFYQPALLEERRARSTNIILMLADDSASMALPQRDDTSGSACGLCECERGAVAHTRTEQPY